MGSVLKFFLKIHLKGFRKKTTTNGFTLIELLVAMILAVLVITPLLGFMVDILQTDRKEGVKATTEQEMQTAYDFIARDLQQALYIYDSDGVTRDNSATATLSGIRNQIPPVRAATGCNNVNTCKPIVVFWKREFLPESAGVSSTTDTNKNDGFAYSLVAYYLITEPSTTWSPSARIGRFQIRGLVNISNSNAVGQGSDVGFNPPPLSSTIAGANLKQKMNQWVAATGAYTQRIATLVDYVHTPPTGVTTPENSFQACENPNPRAIGNITSGFYACVDADQVAAQIFLRGSAYTRLNDSNTIAYEPSNPSNTSYFPIASGRIQGRGFLFTK
ncbi:hormogonium polysaccharide secretion pseudopilin HpsC [Brunnivagina elsteri]|uniref:Prepilin-type cleavage/methylation domain-containing protein n=1 Tax=Brunnivagina elsteri CCALA 953 TaxID=987040 RepID=A0A2A2TR85_9CYAN|nr:hormogonium polysaccharide secretion pseudopilin HpsC [Calothrix elsteri]PAX60668.1 prepilin-type cleavage/methylation domain-containing protein [Calothrix elsteri CCALA 953]